MTPFSELAAGGGRRSRAVATGRGAGRWLAVPVVLALASSVAGCTDEAQPESRASAPAPAAAEASPFADCAALVAPPPATPPGRSAGADLPEIELPCFTGGQPVRLTELRGPAVINLWATWCRPCREELPLMQELAERTAGRLHVIGVDTFDDRQNGASFAADHGVTFATLFDPEKQLLTRLAKPNLPVTVFVAADGERFVYHGKAFDRPTLGGLVREHTGVAVTE